MDKSGGWTSNKRHLAGVSRANAGVVEGSLAVGEAVFKAASRRQLDQLLPFQGVLTLCLCLLTPPIGLQCVGSLAAPAVGAHYQP